MSENFRPSGRLENQTRPIKITTHYTMHAEGSVLMEMGNTKVICTASVEDRVPGWIAESQGGWVTAEYGMLPRATGTRTDREAAKGKQSGRTQEIQRLIGRALRSVVDLKKLGSHTIKLDCDVIQADGGTRCASISGAYVALAEAIGWMIKNGKITENPLKGQVAAISVGVFEGREVCDLDYEEDHRCDTDMNIVMTNEMKFVEIQGTAEGDPFDKTQMDRLVLLAEGGLKSLFEAQRKALGGEGE